MSETLKTKFWRKAAKSLPARYHGELVQAEQFELALDVVVEFLSRDKAPLRMHTRTHSA